jgi:heme-degrading monooxygenase HmoA
MILEVAVLNLKTGQGTEFEAAFAEAQKIISRMTGYISHELQRCLEVRDRYILLVRWETLESHTVGFRSSRDYQLWRELLHQFYDPFPTVEHFALVHSASAGDHSE